MRSSFACCIAFIFVTCVADQTPEAAEILCLLQTKAAKHGHSHHSQEAALTGTDESVIDSAKDAANPTLLLSSFSNEESAHSDATPYGGSMMDLVLGGWRHGHEDPSNEPAAASSGAAAAAVKVAHKSSVVGASETDSISKHVVDAFGNQIEAVNVDLLSTAPARVRVDPVLEDVPPIDFTEGVPSQETADQVLAEAQKSLEGYQAILSDTEKISLLGQKADESESYQAREGHTNQKKKFRQLHDEATADSSIVQHVAEHKSFVELKVAAAEHVASKQFEIIAQETASGLSGGESHSSKGKSAKAHVKQPIRQQNHRSVPAVQ